LGSSAASVADRPESASLLGGGDPFMSNSERAMTVVGKIAAWVAFICAALLLFIHVSQKRFASTVVSGVGLAFA
jgi:hypothetical protein